MSIGGKASCDPAAGVGCDYFTGRMDGVKVYAGTPPVASFTSACTLTSCRFDGTASSDAEGPVTGWAWDFGDGSTGSGSTVTHAYAAGGTFPVRLTVTDASGSTATTTRSVGVQTQAGIAFRSAGAAGTGTGHLRPGAEPGRGPAR